MPESWWVPTPRLLGSLAQGSAFNSFDALARHHKGRWTKCGATKQLARNRLWHEEQARRLNHWFMI